MYSQVIPPSRFPLFPCRSQEVATSSLLSVVVPGLNSGTQPSLSEILHLESDVLCHSQENDFHYMAPPKHWDLQNWVYSHSKTVKVATDCGLFGRQTHGALQCSCYFSKGTRGQWVAPYGKHCKEIQLVNPKGNQSWIFIRRTEADAKTPVVWHQMSRTNLLKNTLMLGKIEGGRTRGRQRMRWLDGIIDTMDMSLRSIR